MKVKKDSINLVNKKKNALSTTAQLLNLKNNKFKTTKNDFTNPKKSQHVKQKLNLALSELNMIGQGLEGKPQQKKTKGNQFSVGLSQSNVKAKKFDKKLKASTKLKGHFKKSGSTKPRLSTSSSQLKNTTTTNKMQEDTVLKPTSPVVNSSINKNKGNKLNSQQFDKSKKTHREPSKRNWWNHTGDMPSKSPKKKKVAKPANTSLNPVGNERLHLNKVTTAVNGLFKVIESKSQASPGLLDLEEPIFMEVECIKIPKGPTKQLRFKLPHRLTDEMTDVLLITTDLKGHKPDLEKSTDHYTELLKKHNITFIQKVMPIRQLRQEYSQYELRQKLVDQFDMILVEASAAKSVPKILGKCVLYNRKMPIAVHLDRKDLKSHLEIALSKTQMTVKPNGHVSAVQVGHTKMSAGEIAANVVEISKVLPSAYPGGWNNIRSLNIKATNISPVLVYISYMSPNMVEAEVVKPQKIKVIEDELTTFPGRTVVVRPDGDVYIKTEVKYQDPVDNTHDEEILKEAENYVQSSRTVRDDDSDDDNDKDAEAITNAVEKELLNKYEKSARRSAEQRDDEDEGEEEDEEEESSEEEEERVLPPTVGKKRKLESAKKGPKGISQGKKFKETKQQHKSNGKQNGETDQIQKRGSRGGKKNKQKINKGQRKAQIKQKKAGKK